MRVRIPPATRSADVAQLVAATRSERVKWWFESTRRHRATVAQHGRGTRFKIGELRVRIPPVARDALLDE